MVIVETTVWIDYLADQRNQHTRWLDERVDEADIGLTDLILLEVLQGIKSEAMFEKTRRRLSQLPVFSTGGEEMALAAARNYRFLRGQGVTVRKTIDCLIASFCILEGHFLLHRDRDYDPFERHLGLRVVHPPRVQ